MDQEVTGQQSLIYQRAEITGCEKKGKNVRQKIALPAIREHQLYIPSPGQPNFFAISDMQWQVPRPA
jgi:hypothetical protein